MRPVYGNLFVLLVSPPGVGKTEAIQLTEDLWRSVPRLQVAPDDVTPASFKDALAAAAQVFMAPDREILNYASLLIAADELGVFLPQYELHFMSILSKMWDNRRYFKETRRGRKEEPIIIDNPQITLLSGSQPAYIQSFLPAEAWGQGYMSRTIMVFDGTAVKVKLFGTKSFPDTRPLREDLKRIAELYGEMQWTPDAAEAIEAWHSAGCPPEPSHAKLKHYNTRRILYGLKLSMISSISRSDDLIISLEDVQRAQNWLVEAETTTGDIFKSMEGKSDAEVVNQVHFWMTQEVEAKGKPIHISRLYLYMKELTPTWNVENVIKYMTQAKLIKQHSPDTWMPVSTLDQAHDV